MSDHGPEFISAEFSAFLQECGIEHRLTTPYCPTSNGCVERTNRTIQSLLKTIVQEGHRWDEHVSRAVISYNHTTHAEIGMSPSQCLLQKSHNVSHNPPLQPELKSQWKAGNPRFASYKIGDLVLRRVELKGNSNINKLMPRFCGPYKIMRVDSLGVTYELEDCETRAVIKSHHSKLKIFKPPPKYLSTNELYLRLNSKDSLDSTENLRGRGAVEDETVTRYEELLPPNPSSCQVVPTVECSSGLSESSWSEESSLSVLSGASVLGSRSGVEVSKVGSFGKCSSFDGLQPICSLCVFESELEEQSKQVCTSGLVSNSVSPCGYIDKMYRQYFGSDHSHVELTISNESLSDTCLTVLEMDISERFNTNEMHGEDGCAVPEAGGSVYDWDVSSIAVESDPSHEDISGSFSGFALSDQRIPPPALLAGRFRSISESGASVPYQMRTRAKGPVENLPNVQPWILERARKGNKHK